jgi:hypothetical protein
MTERVQRIKAVLDGLTQEEATAVYEHLRPKLPKHALEAKWNIRWEVILDAIQRSQDITQRGVRGVIAEASFESKVLPQLEDWEKEPLNGDFPYDFKLRNRATGRVITIQVKLQRTENGIPLKKKRLYPPETYVVEVQRTRTGTRPSGKKTSTPDEAAPKTQTRPYKFGSFDILAVSMQPLTGDWTRFMYTVESWLLPRAKDAHLIHIMQPVNAAPNDVWTDRLDVAIEWALSGEKKMLFDVAKAQSEYQAKKEGERIAKAEQTKAERKSQKLDREQRKKENKP